MKFKDIADMIASAGFPVTYRSWPEGGVPALPYICYYYPSMTPETADDTHHANVYQLNIELYTQNKQFSTESTLEAVLLSAGMVFTKEEDYLNDEHMYEVLYMMEVIIEWEESDTD